VTIRLGGTGDSIELEICDDGVGFDPSGEFPGHLGLQSMRERISLLGGRLDIMSTFGEGSTIREQLPKR
jgi:signal transduction histidine kinase